MGITYVVEHLAVMWGVFFLTKNLQVKYVARIVFINQMVYNVKWSCVFKGQTPKAGYRSDTENWK